MKLTINYQSPRPDVELNNNYPTDNIINLEGYDLNEENKKQYNIIHEKSNDNFEIDIKNTINKPDDCDYFKKPMYQDIEDFFAFHPCQPKHNIPFNYQKAYYSANNKRIWYVYLHSLYCLWEKRRAKYFC